METDLLKNVYLFKDLSVTELVDVLKICRKEEIPSEKFIFLEGDLGDKCYIIEKGEVRISKYIQGAGEEALKILRNGDYFGEMALIDGFPRSATAVANTDVTLLVIDKAALDGALAANRELESKLLRVFCKTLSERLRETNDKISAFLAVTFGFGGPI
jgi:CRP/FNR family cyclic AMP-dependent transcriptional regulator